MPTLPLTLLLALTLLPAPLSADETADTTDSTEPLEAPLAPDTADKTAETTDSTETPEATTAPDTTDETTDSTETLEAPLAPDTADELGVVALAPLPGCAPDASCVALSTLVKQLLSPLRPLSAPQREAALRALPPTGDARLLKALRYIALHDNALPVGEEAIKAVARMLAPERYDTLRELAHRATPELARSAVTSLGALQTTEAATLLLELSGSTTLHRPTRKHAITELKTSYPEFAARQNLPTVSGNIYLPMIGGTFFGGYTLAAVGYWSTIDDGPDIGGFTGGILGAGAGFLLSSELSNARSLYYLSSMGWGLFSGLKLARTFSNFPSEATEVRLGALGELTALGAATVVADRLDLTEGDVWVANAGGLSAAVLTAGLLGFVPPTPDKRAGYGLFTGATLAGVGLGAAVAPHLRFTSGDLALSALGALEGAWYGSFLTDLLMDSHQGPGAAVGMSLGALGAAAWSQFRDYRISSVVGMELGAAYGKVLGAGLVTLFDKEDHVNGAHLLGGALGITAAALSGPELRYDTADIVLLPIATVLGLAHGSVLGFYIADQSRQSEWEREAQLATGEHFEEHDGFNQDQALGLTLTLASGFGIASVVVGQQTSFSTWEVTMSSAGAVWGAWLAGWSLTFSDLEDEEIALATLLASDAGFALASVMVSPILGIDPRVLAGASVSGLVSTGLLTLGATLATDDEDTLTQVNIGATALGLIAGGLATHHLIKSGAIPPLKARDESSSASAALPVRFLGISPQPILGKNGGVDGMSVQLLLAL